MTEVNSEFNINDENGLSVIALFTYKKLAPLKLAVKALQNNRLANKSKLFIFSDGAKDATDLVQILEVRKFLHQIKGFQELTILESKSNKGLAKSILEGVTSLLKSYPKIIVLEDDLLTSSNFLAYMNQALNFYENVPQVHSISGYSMPIKTINNYSYSNYFTKRASSWGWATWRDRWMCVDWEVQDYENFKANKKQQKDFNSMGSDMSSMLAKQMNGNINSWAIRWCFDQFLKKSYTVFPMISKVSNIGFGENATHTKVVDNRFKTILDDTDNFDFKFNPKPVLIDDFTKQFVKKYSIRVRVYYKIKHLLGM